MLKKLLGSGHLLRFFTTVAMLVIATSAEEINEVLRPVISDRTRESEFESNKRYLHELGVCFDSLFLALCVFRLIKEEFSQASSRLEAQLFHRVQSTRAGHQRFSLESSARVANAYQARGEALRLQQQPIRCR